ncbi:hypothetical protein [Levilactobacillus bambusae]|uniref:Uncharacterized protein n=1 Tax=Levilactobacillus bambusae TaxID=2024736 RepID=A0A2V1N0Z7_9LACO|nr:hypothetical protein [Levilactobacillus bambusae]PWG00939.1 hypothetical protein DCM90_01825 [Levilactobacillus bambusae]
MTNDETQSKDVSTLTTSGRLTNYNNAIKSGLEKGISFTKLMDQLINTANPDELVSAATQLAGFRLNSDFVTFPHQYSNADYYLLFMSRLLELHDQGKQVILHSVPHREELSQQLTSLGDRGSFDFIMENNEGGGVFYEEQASGQRLFYLNLEKHMMRFNSHALTQLFIIDYRGDVPEQTIKTALQVLIDFGTYLKRDYGFSVDFNILDTANAQIYPVKDAQLSAEIVDKLFVSAAENGYMLQNTDRGRGAVLQLPDDVVVTVFDNQKDGTPEWAIAVNDPNQAVSWFDVILRYEFMRNWYLNNLGQLEIKSDPLMFT